MQVWVPGWSVSGLMTKKGPPPLPRVNYSRSVGPHGTQRMRLSAFHGADVYQAEERWLARATRMVARTPGEPRPRATYVSLNPIPPSSAPQDETTTNVYAFTDADVPPDPPTVPRPPTTRAADAWEHEPTNEPFCP